MIRWKLVGIIAAIQIVILSFLATPLDTDYFDMMFFGGVIFIVLSWLIGRRGGFLSRNTSMKIGGATGYLLKDDEPVEDSNTISPVMLASIIVSAIGLIASLIKYREYF